MQDECVGNNEHGWHLDIEERQVAYKFFLNGGANDGEVHPELMVDALLH